MKPRVAVVGAGLAGLSAANHLLDQGIDVTVFERSAHPGGRATTTSHGAYRFNQGPHALYLGGEGSRVLKQLEISIDGHAPLLKGARALYQDQLVTLPVGPSSLASTRLLGPVSKLKVGALLARLPRMTGADEVGVTVNEWISSLSDDMAAMGLVRALIRLATYSNAPDLACAGASIAQFRLALTAGVSYLDGGWSQLVDRLHDRAVAGGGVVKREPIGRADDLLDDFDAAILACGGPSAVDALLAIDGTAAVAGPPVEAAVLELGVTTVPEIRFVLGIDEPLYASVHAPPTDLAPPGHSVVYLARYLAPGEDHRPDDTRRQLTELAQRMGVEERQVAESRYLHRMTVAYGQPLAEHGGLAGRPPVDVLGHPRLAVAGDWVGPTGLLADASLASGRDAAQQIGDRLVSA